MPTVPRYTRAERAADAAVHAMGLSACLGAWVLLAVAVPHAGSGAGRIAALLAYGLGLGAMLGCSALYNLAAEGGPRKAVLRRLDHAAIFVMIAGTYTPVVLLGLEDGARSRALLAAVWACAAAGALLKLLAPPGRFERISIAAYLLLGWAGLAMADALLAALPGPDLALLGAGGLLYSLGVALHLATRLPYHNALWHLCVLAAAGCHFALVLRLAARAVPGGGGGG